MQEAARLDAVFQMWTDHGGRVHLEPTGRRVRAMLGSTTVADSARAQLLFMPPPFNFYAFPREDVRLDLARESGSRSVPGVGEVQLWSVTAGDKVKENAMWSFPRPPEGLEPLAGLVVFRWHLIDAWYEEDDEVFVHPRDPYHRVDVLNSSRHVKVVLGGQVVAETRQPRLLFETGLRTRYYIPKVDVRMDLLEPTSTVTQCPYKGNATYWSARIGDHVYPDIVWSYPFPIPECTKIQNLLAFYNEKTEIYVDGELEKAPTRPR